MAQNVCLVVEDVVGGAKAAMKARTKTRPGMLSMMVTAADMVASMLPLAARRLVAAACGHRSIGRRVSAR
jgi:hypothetical protein